MRLTFTFLAACFLTFSCKKDVTGDEPCEPIVIQNHSNDTIFPSDYLMAYPGSWWEYDDGFIDSCDYWETVPIRTTTTSGTCLLINEDQKILPEGLIYAENISSDQSVVTISNNTTHCAPLYDTVVGVFFDETTSGGSGLYSYSDQTTIETIERLNSIVVGSNSYNDVLHVRKVVDRHYGHINGGPVWYYEYWFARNVGLIKYAQGENGSVPDNIELVDHFIAPH